MHKNIIEINLTSSNFPGHLEVASIYNIFRINNIYLLCIPTANIHKLYIRFFFH